jgi:hypothetical protein
MDVELTLVFKLENAMFSYFYEHRNKLFETIMLYELNTPKPNFEE